MIREGIYLAVADVVCQLLGLAVHARIDVHRHGVWILSGQLADLVHHLLDIALVWIAAVGFTALQLISEVGAHRQIAFLFADVAMLVHHAQRLVAAVGGRFIVIGGIAVQVVWVIRLRRVDDAGQEGAFGQVQLIDVLTEVILRGILHAAGAAVAAEPDQIQIVDDDRLLVDALLREQAQVDLLDLMADRFEAGDRLSIVDLLFLHRPDPGVVHQLHRQRASALRQRAAGQVVERRTDEARQVKAVMLEEAGILDRQERVDQILRKIFIFDIVAVLASQLRDHIAIPVIDVGARPRHQLLRVEVRRVADDIDQQGEHADTAGQHDRQDKDRRLVPSVQMTPGLLFFFIGGSFHFISVVLLHVIPP